MGRSGVGPACAWAGAVAVVVAVGGCGAGATQDVVAGSPSVALVDADDGVVRLPLEQYGLTPAEEGVYRTARSLGIARCMSAAGHGDAYQFKDRRSTPPPEDRRYGVWIRTTVAQYGYEEAPHARGPLLRNQETPARMTPAAAVAFRTCRDGLAARGLLAPPAPRGVSAPAAAPPSGAPAAVQVLREWTDCLRENGVAPPPAPDQWVPAGAVHAALAEQIRIGLVDVGCKEDLDVVARLAAVDAAAQTDEVQQRRAELEAYRTALDAVVARSAALLAAN